MNIGDRVIHKGHPATNDPVCCGIGTIIDIRDVPDYSVQVLWNTSNRAYWYDPTRQLMRSKDYVEWKDFSLHTMPESCSSDESCNPYYVIELIGGQRMLAMFMDGEWWSSYTCKVVSQVKRWLCEDVEAYTRRKDALMFESMNTDASPEN